MAKQFLSFKTDTVYSFRSLELKKLLQNVVVMIYFMVYSFRFCLEGL